MVQTKHNPFTDLNTLVLENKSIHRNNPKKFPLPVPAKSGNLHFEAQNPNAHLADILFKRSRETQYAKHKQDIMNLKQITDSDKVKRILSLY